MVSGVDVADLQDHVTTERFRDRMEIKTVLAENIADNRYYVTKKSKGGTSNIISMIHKREIEEELWQHEKQWCTNLRQMVRGAAAKCITMLTLGSI